MSVTEEMKKEFARLNPLLDSNNLNQRADGRVEWMCTHGVGHTIYAPKIQGDSGFVHGCDDCCRNVRIIKKITSYQGH